MALAADPASASAPQIGSRGAPAREWQALLNRIFREGAVAGRPVDEDGVFGPATQRATRAVQGHLRLSQDGVVGPRTRSAVSELGCATGVSGSRPGNDAQDIGRRLRTGMRGADVREWQRMVNIAVELGRLGHPRLALDGGFGPQTRSPTIALQRTLKVTADGAVGSVTRQATASCWKAEDVPQRRPDYRGRTPNDGGRPPLPYPWEAHLAAGMIALLFASTVEEPRAMQEPPSSFNTPDLRRWWEAGRAERSRTLARSL